MTSPSAASAAKLSLQPTAVRAPAHDDSTADPPRKVRRFAAAPVEVSTRSHRNTVPRSNETDLPSDNGLGSAASTGVGKQDTMETSEHKPTKRRFAPQPVEVSSRSHRKQLSDCKGDEASASTEKKEHAPPVAAQSSSSPEAAATAPPRPARRRFAPQLIETARRSRKSGDTLPAVLESDKTNVCPGDLTNRKPPYRPLPTPVVAPSNTPVASSDAVPQLGSFLSSSPSSSTTATLPRRQGSLRPQNPTRYNTRQHSFKVPDLPKIDSSESEASDAPSLSPSHSNDSQTSNEGPKDATRLRESQDDRFSGYLLQLAAKAAEKQLREQAAAAFVNSDFHEPVAHYVDDSGSDDDAVEEQAAKKHRDSEEENWALREMRKHGEDRFKGQLPGKKQQQFNVEFDEQTPKQDAWISPSTNTPFVERSGRQGPVIGGWQRGSGVKEMRKAASPPMLGGSIDFPRCASPDNARFDVTQGAEYLKEAMLMQDHKDAGGLWVGGGGQGDSSTEKSPTGSGPCGGGTWCANKANMQPHTPNNGRRSCSGVGGGEGGGGLWGGFCTESDNKMAASPIGLVTPLRTPNAERDDPFASFKLSIHTDSTAIAPPRSPAARPPSPPNSFDKRASQLSHRLEIEQQLEMEFSDSFVTQVYNYLSIGYPSIGKKYDEELSRIARVPLEQLRQDDKLAEARGYVRLGSNEVDIPGEDVGLTQDTIVTEEMCMRWKALRSYVREWGRQMIQREKDGGIAKLDPHRAWGLPARKGSWGF